VVTFHTLSTGEKQAIREAIIAVLISPAISPDECHDRYGVPFQRIKDALRKWPDFDESDEDIRLSIHGCLNEVCYGIVFGDDPDVPGMTEAEWPKWFSVSREDMRLIFQRWRELDKKR
jgi:hypothetical protein